MTVQPVLLNSLSLDFTAQLERLRQRADPSTDVLGEVARILADVRRRGDAAVAEYTCRFDRHAVRAEGLEVSAGEMAAAAQRVPTDLLEALQEAAGRIRAFHSKQLQQSWSIEDQDGNIMGQRISPLDRVGIYVPGGKAAYPSSVLMNAIPAQVAGVSEIVMTVPAPEGERNASVLAAAHIMGIHRVFAIGGAQAIAALTWGTEQIPRVDKIVGPGNMWVSTAKRLVFGYVGLDMIAGPSEILIVADGSADPDCLVMDMFAQLEHDELASALLVSPHAALLEKVRMGIQQRLPEMKRVDTLRAALSNSALILVPDLPAAASVVNQVAPEHLQLAVDDPDTLLHDVRHAGSIFLGHWSAEVFGDYCAGPNHVLPTGGTARFSSPLGVYDFQKFSSLLRCTRHSVTRIAGLAECLAHHEGLFAHARSARMRLE